MRRCVYLGRKWCAVIEPGMRSCTHGYNCYTNISVHWFIRIMLLNPALYTSDLMLCVSVCWGLLQSDWGFWCMERANKAARKCHYVCVFNVYYSRMSCGRKSMQWEHSSYQFLISLSLRKHTVTHNEKTLTETRCLTMSDCTLGTLYSKAVVPSESRKVILLGRSILKDKMRDNMDKHFIYKDTVCCIFIYITQFFNNLVLLLLNADSCN